MVTGEGGGKEGRRRKSLKVLVEWEVSRMTVFYSGMLEPSMKRNGDDRGNHSMSSNDDIES